MIEKFKDVETLDKKSTKRNLVGLLEILQSSLLEGNQIVFKGFGKFHTYFHRARNGINPRNLQPIRIDSCKHLKFKTSEIFQDKMNQRIPRRPRKS